MTHQPDPIESDIARAFESLRSAPPPEGMEARITARLATHTPSPSRWRILTPSSTWLRGALTGALVATAACTLAFFITRSSRPAAQTTNARVPHPYAVPSAGARADGEESAAPNSPAPVALDASADCPGTILGAPPKLNLGGNSATSARVPHSSQPYRNEWKEKSPRLIPASFAPSRPAPPEPLTAQERVLIQLVRTATPAQLAALNRAQTTASQSDAAREADFQKFFAPSPELLAVDKAEGIAVDPDSANTPPRSEVHN